MSMISQDLGTNLINQPVQTVVGEFGFAVKAISSEKAGEKEDSFAKIGKKLMSPLSFSSCCFCKVLECGFCCHPARDAKML